MKIMNKSTTAEIRERFDKDVERFSNLNTGQVSIIDADISLELITETAKRIKPQALNILDVGCGAGNYTLKILSKLPGLQCTLVDLSKPMLDRAFDRVSKETSNKVEIIQGDIRDIKLPDNHFDIVLAGAVLHHLRDEKDWEFVFTKLYQILNAGGCLMISDLVTQDSALLTEFFWDRYGDYLEKLGGTEYRQKVLDYVAKEDSPRSLNFQFDLMKKIGFSHTEVLHKNACFAAYCGIK
jgi:tRNA (cmo5U34)-methyltransferase